jgi:hypothetical protein
MPLSPSPSFSWLHSTFGALDWYAAESSSLGRPRPVNGAPNHGAGGRQADSRNPGRKSERWLCLQLLQSRLQLNDISISFNVFEMAPDKSYFRHFPDVSLTEKTVEDAIEMAGDAITGYVESLTEDGEIVPV